MQLLDGTSVYILCPYNCYGGGDGTSVYIICPYSCYGGGDGARVYIICPYNVFLSLLLTAVRKGMSLWH
jgi:hypothetical protein